ncbi:hypothetical protein [Mycobacterium camsae]|uniref:hypothetical protein n=1 Tax=Mycobacterium gordonae TaxID=1778 RepID=UPI00197DFD85|nr:hypothetical protein [Mycobacterium gordonae]
MVETDFAYEQLSAEWLCGALAESVIGVGMEVYGRGPLLDTAENLDLARMLAHRGLDASTPDIFRIAQTVAWCRWTDIASGLGADPEELREVLNLSMSRLSEFLDAACRYVCAPTQADWRHADIEHQRNLKRRALIESLLYGTATDTDTAVVAGLLGYRLDLPHTAAVIWSDRGDDDAAALVDAARALIEACAGQSLSVTSGAQSQWVWAHQVECVDPGQIEAAIAPQVYMALGGPGYGITGFVRSHRDALATQRIMAQLKCP